MTDRHALKSFAWQFQDLAQLVSRKIFSKMKPSKYAYRLVLTDQHLQSILMPWKINMEMSKLNVSKPDHL